MHVAIDITPLSNDHQVRGTGSYTKNLIYALQKYEKRHSYSFFVRTDIVPENADIVHYPYFEPFFLTLPLQKTKPTVVTVHDLIPLVFPDKFPAGLKGRIKWEIQRRSLRTVARIIADSEQSKQDVERIVGFSAENIDVVSLAPAEAFLKMDEKDQRGKKESERVKKKYRLPEQFVLYVGDVNWNKNIPGLLRAFQRVKIQKVKQDIHLVLVGQAFTERGLQEAKEIRQLIAHLKLTKAVKMLGFVPEEDLVALYNLASVYVQPSFYEGFGLPILEAMACGCPVVCSDVASLREIGGPAISVDPASVANLASAILRASKLSKTERGQLMAKELAWAKQFTWKNVAEQTVKIYEKVLANQ